MDFVDLQVIQHVDYLFADSAGRVVVAAISWRHTVVSMSSRIARYYSIVSCKSWNPMVPECAMTGEASLYQNGLVWLHGSQNHR
jgi:hypothetical protein